MSTSRLIRIRGPVTAGLALALLIAANVFGLARTSAASVDDALSFAHEAAHRYAQEGFQIREDAWGGDLGPGEKKTFTLQLFRGNEYCFAMASDDESAVINIHVYDPEGNLAEAESARTGKSATARVVPKATGTYYVVVEVEKTKEDRAHWAVVYGFR